MVKALMVETKVKDGTMTSSPGWISSKKAAISSAWVQEVVNKAFATPSRCSSQAWHWRVKAPSPECGIFDARKFEPPTMEGLLKGSYSWS
jgi:hypothetical protein